jgi:hypothetical protein
MTKCASITSLKILTLNILIFLPRLNGYPPLCYTVEYEYFGLYFPLLGYLSGSVKKYELLAGIKTHRSFCLFCFLWRYLVFLREKYFSTL